jgi:hypothetical protein
MPRKINGNDTTNRGKKAAVSPEPLAVQNVPKIRRSVETINLNEEIRRRAYEIYLERGRAAGDEHQDWLIAEREIRARHREEYPV